MSPEAYDTCCLLNELSCMYKFVIIVVRLEFMIALYMFVYTFEWLRVKLQRLNHLLIFLPPMHVHKLYCAPHMYASIAKATFNNTITDHSWYRYLTPSPPYPSPPWD